MTDAISIHNLSSVGVVRDRKPHTLAPEAWTTASNVRLVSDGLERFKGHSVAIGSPLGVPQFIASVPGLTETAWIYCSSTRAYVFLANTNYEITRKVAGSFVPYLTLSPHDWEAVLLGGIPVLNNQADPPQWWAAIDGGVPLAPLPAWPSGVLAKSITAFGQYLVAMNIKDGVTSYPNMVWWSHKADPGTVPSSWDYADPTVDAGRLELTDATGGEIIEGLLLGNQMIIYKQLSTHALRFIGGQDKFSPELLLTTSGILTAKCACSFNKGTQHFVVSADDILIHAGTRSAESIVDGLVRKAIFADMDSTNYVNSFVFDNPKYKEVWFAFPTGGATYPTKAAVWGYGSSNRGWTFRDFTGCAADRGKFSQGTTGTWNTATLSWDLSPDTWATPAADQVLFCDNGSSKIYILDSGDTFDGAQPQAIIERTGLAIYGRDRQGNPKVDYKFVKLLTRVWPKLSGGSCNVTCGVQDHESQEVTWGTPVVFNSDVDDFVDVDPPISGRLLAVRFELLTPNTQLSGYDIEVTKISNL